MDFKDAQKDMRHSYNGGGTGVFVSGIVWLTAGVLAIMMSSQASILTFFFGGMLIHPLGIVFSKLLHRTGKHQQNNPLAKLALESTVLLFMGLFISYSIYQVKQEWFFSIMLMIIGARYLVFQSIYAMKQYWILGMILICLGIICVQTNQPLHIAALIGGGVEVIFAFVIIRSEKRMAELDEKHEH